MLLTRDSIVQSVDALRAHKLRAALSLLGLLMGVATLITVMTIVQGANVYVEQKIANLGSNVFQVARTPFAATDFEVVIRALKHKHINRGDWRAIQDSCPGCTHIGASAESTVRVRHADSELQDVRFLGHSAEMAEIDTRVVETGRYFTEQEDQRSARVAIVGTGIVQQFFPAVSPLGKTIRAGNEELTVIGTFEKVGSVLGQDQDALIIVPLGTFLRMKGARFSLMLNIKTEADRFQTAMDQVYVRMRAIRHLTPGMPDDFFIGTKDSYMSLWQSISGAFFAVFVMVSSISAVVGGIVIMNVMLVSVTERTKEIGVRRAVGATRGDIRKQFLVESVVQCLIGGSAGVLTGFALALAISTLTAFPAAVQPWVAVLGFVLSSGIGLFFGIYPAVRASQLDPVVALRAE